MKTLNPVTFPLLVAALATLAVPVHAGYILRVPGQFRAASAAPPAVPQPVAVLFPNPVNLGEVVVGTTSAPVELSISNTGTGILQLSELTFGGSELGFTVTEGSCGPLPKQLGSQQSCALEVSVTPTATGGLDGVVNVTTNDAVGVRSVALQATGGAAPCTAGKQVFSYTGTDQNITVPAGCATATIKAWGAGARSLSSQPGGGGGFAQRTINGLAPGTPLVVVVGQGSTSGVATYGGGAGASNTAAGGGYSGVFETNVSQTNARVVAGGGGGGGYHYRGRAGGGATGQGGPVSGGGGGGTQTSGGIGYENGWALKGGIGSFYGGGGGGGYWGGGGGYYSGVGYYGGGGGSGYAPDGTLTSGIDASVANSTDTDYAPNIGNGSSTIGQNGRVVIIWH